MLFAGLISPMSTLKWLNCQPVEVFLAVEAQCWIACHTLVRSTQILSKRSWPVSKIKRERTKWKHGFFIKVSVLLSPEHELSSGRTVQTETLSEVDCWQIMSFFDLTKTLMKTPTDLTWHWKTHSSNSAFPSATIWCLLGCHFGLFDSTSMCIKSFDVDHG